MAARRIEGRSHSWTWISLVVLVVVFLGTAHQVFGIPWPLAQQTSPHEIFKTYGDWNGDRCYVDTIAGTPPTYETYIAYHTGVDLPADSGTAVLAVFDGYVTAIKPAVGDTGLISIARTLGGNPAWHYGHVIPLPTLAESTAVSYGDTLGYVARFNNQTIGDHLHFYLEEEVGNLTQSACNPLDSLLPAPGQDARFAQRLPIGTHKYMIDYVKDGDETIRLEETLWDTTYQEYLLRDSVDIVVGPIVIVEGNYDPGVYGLGFAVEPVDTGGSIPYRTMLEMKGTFQVGDSLEYYLTLVDPQTSPYEWPLSRYIVTNCGDNLPSPTKGISNVEENCWPTRVDTNGTGQPHLNAEARCKNGLDNT